VTERRATSTRAHARHRREFVRSFVRSFARSRVRSIDYFFLRFARARMDATSQVVIARASANE